MQVNIYKLNSMSQAEVAQLLRRSEIDIESLHETVRPIIKDVKEKGDAAIIEYNAKFDKASMTASQLRVRKNLLKLEKLSIQR